MRDLAFKFGTELIGIKIENNRDIKFCKLAGSYFRVTPIEGLKLSVSGILKEFPDLKDMEEAEMRIEAIKRFKKKIKGMKTEEEIQNYLKDDLRKHGYKLVGIRRNGFREKKVRA